MNIGAGVCAANEVLPQPSRPWSMYRLGSRFPFVVIAERSNLTLGGSGCVDLDGRGNVCVDMISFLSALSCFWIRPSAVLLCARRPAAIPGFVVPIIVWVTIYAVFRGRLQSHISQEVFKRMPSLANLDTPAAVAMEPFDLGVIATPQHCIPGVVFRRPIASCVPVPKRRYAGLFLVIAPTRNGTSASERDAQNLFLDAAFTNHIPCRKSVTVAV